MLLAGMAFAAGGDASAALAINAADLRSRLDAISRQAPGASGYQVAELGREGNRVLFSRREDDPR